MSSLRFAFSALSIFFCLFRFSLSTFSMSVSSSPLKSEENSPSISEAISSSEDNREGGKQCEEGRDGVVVEDDMVETRGEEEQQEDEGG